MSKIYTPAPDVDDDNRWLDWPEECLWINYPDHTSLIPRPRLEALYSGNEQPLTRTEEILVSNPQWFRTLLDYALGEYVITIQANTPLPEWDAAWLVMKEKEKNKEL